ASPALFLDVPFAACDRTTPDSLTTATLPTVDPFSGSRRSVTASATAGACSSTNWTVTPTGPNSEHLSHTATCSGLSVFGSGSDTERQHDDLDDNGDPRERVRVRPRRHGRSRHRHRSSRDLVGYRVRRAGGGDRTAATVKRVRPV